VAKVVSATQALEIYRLAQTEMQMSDEQAGLKGIVMLKDTAGSGYWRMVLPAQYMNKDGIFIDVTAAAVRFDYLLEYDTIFVQRLHDWESFYVLEKLKAAGKRVVYDLDDDLFSVTPDNPVSSSIGRDQQLAAAACMRLANCVTCSTPELKRRLEQLIGVKPVVIPNALNPDDGWPEISQTGSSDGWKRIFWQGSATHGTDWMECFEAVDEVMRTHDKVRVVILGFLPPIVQAHLGEPHWKGRVEYLGFSNPETYFALVKHLRAEVGIAPLASTTFNAAKSSIKWLEYTLIGMPTVASDWVPYQEVISNGTDGFLCSTKEDWVQSLNTCLFDKNKRLSILKQARKKACECYDIRSTAKAWRDVLVS
jgi:glycosyltransferase involved in cell wall biosynthesis